MKSMKLIKDKEGPIEIFKSFWPSELNDVNTVPDIIVYCDLLESGIDRNIETADLLVMNIKKRISKYEYR